MERRAGITYRMAIPQDALCLSVLAAQVFLDTYAPQGIRPAVAREVRQLLSEEAFAEHLTRSRNGILVAERSEHLLGFAQLTHGQTHTLLPPEAKATELSRLYVQRPFLGQGLGKELLTRSEALAAGEGADLLWLTAWTGNAHALRFYEARGYQDVGDSVYTFEGDRYETRVFLKRLSPWDRRRPRRPFSQVTQAQLHRGAMLFRAEGPGSLSPAQRAGSAVGALTLIRRRRRLKAPYRVNDIRERRAQS